jgi:hypothetical protein
VRHTIRRPTFQRERLGHALQEIDWPTIYAEGMPGAITLPLGGTRTRKSRVPGGCPTSRDRRTTFPRPTN